jgi:23S rRNA (adenine-N6)-dimethyltransferase
VRASAAPRWGWHRLTDDWAARIVAGAHIARGDLVLDVGAGTGALTAHLLDAGARVVAFELHARRAHELRERFAGAPVTVVRADASDLRLPRRPFRVVANPPFGITTSLLRRLLAPGSRLLTADLVVPYHAARRWAERNAPGAGRWHAEFDACVARAVPRHAFVPPPPSGAALLVVRRRGVRDDGRP